MLRLLKTKTFENLYKLVGGTIVAQIIPILTMPLLTRIFDPQDFGRLSIFVGIVGVIAVAASMRFELAIPQAQNDTAAKNIFSVCLLINVVLTFILFLIIIVTNTHLFALFNLEGSSDGSFFYLVVLSIFCAGLIQAAVSKSIRLSEFKNIALGKILVSAGYVSFQLLFGIISIKSGLIFGYLMGQVLGAAYFISRSISWLPSKQNRFKMSTTLGIAKEFRDLPVYSAPSAIVDAFCSTLPLLVVAATYDITTVGMLGMAYRVLGIPASMISLSVSQVIFQKVASSDGFKPGFIRRLLIQSMLGLALIIIPFALIINIFGPDLFALVLGEKWRPAGNYAGVLVVGLSVQFLASPNSIVLTLKENVKLGAFWQILRLMTVSLVLFFGRNYDFETFLRVFVLHEVFIYLIYIWFIFIGAQRRVAC